MDPKTHTFKSTRQALEAIDSALKSGSTIEEGDVIFIETDDPGEPEMYYVATEDSLSSIRDEIASTL